MALEQAGGDRGTLPGGADRGDGPRRVEAVREAVEVVFNGVGGLVKSLPIGVVIGGSQWQPTLPYPVIASLLPLLPGQLTPVSFRFTPILGGSWQIDDVYVDPFKAR